MDNGVIAHNIRFMITKDHEQVLAIEAESFQRPWSDQDLANAMRHRHTFGLVVEDHNNVILGYIIYELHPNRFHILNLAVHLDKMRQGIGCLLINRLKSKLSNNKHSYSRRNSITVDVSDANLKAHLFFKSLGFIATAVIKEAFKDCADDAYHMVYREEQ